MPDDRLATAAALPAFAALLASARTQQVLAGVSRRTNLTLAGSTAVVVGDGPLAAALRRALHRIGTHVVAAAGPRTRVAAVQDGLRTLDPADLADLAAATGELLGGGRGHLLVTGEGHAPLDPTRLTGVLGDASLRATGFRRATRGTPVRPGVVRLGSSWVVDLPTPLPDTLEGADALSWRVADVVVALLLLVAGTDAGPDALEEADVTLARLALA